MAQENAQETSKMLLELCSECNEEVKNADKAVDCDLCKKWVHLKCGKISVSMYGELRKLASGSIVNGIKFLCTKCDKAYAAIKCDLVKMIEKQNKMETSQAELSEEVIKIKTELEELKKKVENAKQVKVETTN